MSGRNNIGVEDKSTKVQGYLTITRMKDGKVLEKIGPMPNKVVSSNGYGRNLIARQLVGDTTYQIEVDSASVGDDNTAPTDSDTGLGNALVSDISISNSGVTGDQVSIDVFASDGTLPDDTYEEFGLFIDSRLFARVIISPAYTKATGEDTVFNYSLTIS